MKLTLLDIVQRTLSAMDSINVSSITDDSIEAEQVVLATNRIYEEILGRYTWKFLRTSGPADSGSLAWELDLPQTLMSLEEIKYNKKIILYKTPEEFQWLVDHRTVADPVNSSGIYTDRDPVYYTSFNDLTLRFDSYNLDDGIALVPASSNLIYYAYPDSDLNADTDIPQLPFRFHEVLLSGVLYIAFDEIKQDEVKSRKHEARYRSGLARMRRWASTIEDSKERSNDQTNYGRRANNYGRRIRVAW